MRSLWRIIAARWLGGRASEALTGDSALLELLTIRDGGAQPSFLVRRLPEVSHRAMMAQHGESQPDREAAIAPASKTEGEG